MAKLKSPLLSFSAHGTLGDVLVFFDRHGKSYVRKKPQDPVSLSLGQGVLRDCFVSAAISAHSLTQGQKDSYAALAPNSAFCPWWNNFIGQYIKDNYEAPSVVSTFIKSVQIVVGTIPDGSRNVDVLIDAVDIDFTVPFSLGFAPPNADPRNGYCFSILYDSTHIRFDRNSAPMTNDLKCSCCVIEFEPDFVVSYQVFNLTFESADTVVTETIDEVDISKSFIFPCGWRVASDVDINQINSYCEFQDSTTVKATRSTGGSWLYQRVAVMEFI